VRKDRQNAVFRRAADFDCLAHVIKLANWQQ
jgi:hypothetical protein